MPPAPGTLASCSPSAQEIFRAPLPSVSTSWMVVVLGLTWGGAGAKMKQDEEQRLADIEYQRQYEVLHTT
eukprot:gene9075-1630_t